MKHLLSGDGWTLTGWYRNQWRFTRSMELDRMLIPDVPTVQATVPGAVQADLLAAGLLEDPFVGTASRRGEWVNNREWFLDRSFSVPGELADSEKLFLVFEGLDSEGEIYLNGERLCGFSGMFLPLEVEVTGALRRDGENLLRVVFFQSPEVDGQYGFTDRIRHIRSRFGYVWDWCPRIVAVGIWDDVFLAGFTACRIRDFFPRPVRRDTGWVVSCRTEAEAFGRGVFRLRCTVSRDGTTVAESDERVELPATRSVVEHDIRVPSPELWFPAGEGAQPLYDVTLELLSDDGTLLERQTKRIGFRSFGAILNENSPPGARPYTLEVNGRALFLKGVNWVPLSPLFGTVRRERYEAYLRRFRDMGCNLIRVWGGAILEKEAFYDLCDSLGLLVWQEFPQSSSGISNLPSDDPAFLEDLEKVAGVYLSRRRHHASLAIWCGGNELMWDNYLPVDERHSNIAMLADLVSRLDPGKIFLPASASGPRFCAGEAEFGAGVHHDVHGPWLYGGEEAHYRFFNGDDALFRSETGCPAPSRLEQLEKFSGGMDLWPPDRTNLYWTHRGSWWLQLDEMTRLFGSWEPHELGRYLSLARYLQAEALRYAAESTLRRRPSASGFLVWMGNEPFPNNANTSVLEYDGMPKPSYNALREVFSELHVSAKFDRLVWERGERFSAEVFLTKQHPDGSPVQVTAELFDAAGTRFAGFEQTVAAAGFTVSAGTLSAKLDPVLSAPPDSAAGTAGVFFLRLTAGEHENGYIFCTAERNGRDGWIEPFAAIRALPVAEVAVKRAADGLYAENISAVPASGVSIKGRNPAPFLSVEPGFLFLLPGEKRKLRVKRLAGTDKAAGEENFTDSAAGSDADVAPEDLTAEGPNLR